MKKVLGGVLIILLMVLSGCSFTQSKNVASISNEYENQMDIVTAIRNSSGYLISQENFIESVIKESDSKGLYLIVEMRLMQMKNTKQMLATAKYLPHQAHYRQEYLPEFEKLENMLINLGNGNKSIIPDIIRQNDRMLKYINDIPYVKP